MDLAAKRQLLRDLALRTLSQLAPARLLAARVHRDAGRLHVGDRSWDLGLYRQILVLAFGKAAVPMAQTCAQLLGLGPESTAPSPAPSRASSPPSGSHPPLRLIISAPEPFLAPGQAVAPWSDVQQFVGGHPEPNADSLAAGHAMLAAAHAAPPESLCIHLISGGGSALVEAPLPELSLADLQTAYGALVRSGAPIGAINALRKHLSAFKGGRLALAAPPTADQLSLIVSDVPAGDIASVASGPTCPDPTTVQDCYRLVAEHSAELPPKIAALCRDRRLPETPKPGHPAFARCAWEVLMDDRGAAALLANQVRAAGYEPVLDHTTDETGYVSAAAYLVGRIRALKNRNPKACLIAVGEVCVTVTGPAGLGGRNQMFALECARQIQGEDLCVLSLGTDGVDGNSPAAGALVDGATVTRAAALGFDLDRSLAAFDAYPLLAAIGDSLETGPTRTNVRDLRLLF